MRVLVFTVAWSLYMADNDINNIQIPSNIYKKTRCVADIAIR